MSTFPRYNKIKSKQGFTLIELIIVISIIGSIMALGLNLLRTFWQKQSSGITSLEMMQIIDVAREKSLSTGKIYSLTFNTDKRFMQLTEYNPAYESFTIGVQIDEELEEIDDEKKNKKPSVMFRSNIPSQIIEFYTPAGIPLTIPVFFLHFYPDGTSDSIIFKYKEREKPFHYIPRTGGRGIFLSDLKMINNEEH